MSQNALVWRNVELKTFVATWIQHHWTTNILNTRPSLCSATEAIVGFDLGKLCGPSHGDPPLVIRVPDLTDGEGALP